MPVDVTKRRGGFIVLLTVAAVLRLFFVLATPPGTGGTGTVPGFNDEQSHFNYVRYLAEQKRFPVQSMSINHPEAFTRNEFEYYQPPLFYLIAVPFYYLGRIAGGLEYICIRVLCVAAGLLAITIAFKTLLLLFNGNRAKALSGMLLLSLAGVSVRFSSLISNDSLLWLIAGTYVYLLLRRVYGMAYRRQNIMLMLLIGAGMLTKSSFLTLLPALFISFVDLSSWRKTMVALMEPAGILAGGLVLCAPWYIRNLMLYHDLLALSVGSGAPLGLGFTALKSMAFIVYQNVFSFWFPFVTWPYGRAVKSAVVVYTLVSGTVVAAALGAVYRSGIQRAPGLKAVLLLATLAVPLVAGSVRFSLVYGQVNFRHVMALQGLWAGIAVLGISRFVKKPVFVNGIVAGSCVLVYAAAFLLL